MYFLIRFSDEGTPLHNAAFNGHIECLKLLVESNANTNAEDNTGSTPLHHAVKKGNKSCASYLIKVIILINNIFISSMEPK